MTTMGVELIDVGKLQDHYPQGRTAEFIELICIPYRIPPDVDGQPTIKKALSNEV